MTDDTYVDLFSNSSLDLYPENIVSKFKVKLPQPLSLEGEYECSMAQMICPATTSLKIGGEIILSTFPEGYNQKAGGQLKEQTIPFNDPASSIFRARPATTSTTTTGAYRPKQGFHANKFYSYVYKIPEDKSFKDGKELVDFINDLFTKPSESRPQNEAFSDVIQSRTIPLLPEEGKSFPAEFAVISNYGLNIKIRDPDFSITISGPLARVLGFDVADNQWVVLEERGEYTFRGQKADLNASRPGLLAIYSNIILPHRVGDTSAPLLRVCTVPKSNFNATVGEFINFEPVTPHYLPVALKYIQEIQVEIRGNDGTLIPFQAGVCFLRLHFKSRH